MSSKNSQIQTAEKLKQEKAYIVKPKHSAQPHRGKDKNGPRKGTSFSPLPLRTKKTKKK